ncbi:YpjP family protein [Ureibacillus thermosphaericus]|uniref:YpjP-like protein n=1 Tax=Ureibacillus thermosphaericus TaxID=51173 RepID=A0A840PS55_URETH|nr:YpjP family protein [Ureibacillus thermosphaericus]MBB5149309.1 hypothetical protein [Ureibacillus thermosphaericus]NKZ32113.1 hypothetical protein [Ureibacillus thermosphaericus]
MKNIIKLISVALIFSLIVTTTPIFSFAKENEIEKLQQKWHISDEDLEKSLELISNNKELFMEIVDQEELDSYNIEDENTALLLYFLNTDQINNNVNARTLSSNDAIIQPTIWGSLVRVLVSQAVKKKMGKKIQERIGDEVEKKVIPKFQDAAENATKKYGYKGHKGPEYDNGQINQGEHILSIQDDKGDFIRFHVNINPSRNTTTWHWHLRDDNFNEHYGQIQLQHNSLPKWGSE